MCIRSSEELCEQGRNFCNKIWNAFRLVNGWQVDENKTQTEIAAQAVKWFEARLRQRAATMADLYSRYRLSEALMEVYQLFWDDFSGWFLELVKPPYGEPIDAATQHSVLEAFDHLLHLLHPFMPFITEELWQQLETRKEGESIMVSPQQIAEPQAGDEALLREMAIVREVVSSVRAVRNTKQIALKETLHLQVVGENPVKAYDAIRDLMAEQPLAKQMGFTPQFFSFNTDGGRCEECKGAGYVTIEMQFMADLTLTCEACKGKRFKHDILEVRYGGKDVNDVLNMTVNEAIEFFSDEKLQRNEGDFDNCRIIVNRLKPLQDVGLGYIKLGQNSSSLSGGENQRVKLAFFIGKEEQEPTLFIFDEPTTGLHFHDIRRLLHAFNALIERGHSLVVIEHNLDVIKCADYIIDLGPDGGDKGGNLVACGTPQQVAACPSSITGQFLKKYLPK